MATRRRNDRLTIARRLSTLSREGMIPELKSVIGMLFRPMGRARGGRRAGGRGRHKTYGETTGLFCDGVGLTTGALPPDLLDTSIDRLLHAGPGIFKRVTAVNAGLWSSFPRTCSELNGSFLQKLVYSCYDLRRHLRNAKVLRGDIDPPGDYHVQMNKLDVTSDHEGTFLNPDRTAGALIKDLLYHALKRLEHLKDVGLRLKLSMNMGSCVKVEVWVNSLIDGREEGAHRRGCTLLGQWCTQGEDARAGYQSQWRKWYVVKVYCKTIDLLTKDSVFRKVGSSIATLLAAGTPDPVLTRTLLRCRQKGMTRIEISHLAAALYGKDPEQFLVAARELTDTVLGVVR